MRRPYSKITMRHLGANDKAVVEPLTGEDIRAIREQAHMSQAVFAHYLNLTVGYVSQLERGTKRPTGAALALLNVIRRKGDRRDSFKRHGHWKRKRIMSPLMVSEIGLLRFDVWMGPPGSIVLIR